MARLFADENFPQPVVEHLRSLGHDVITCGEAGLANQRIEDARVLDMAIQLGRAVLTHNRRHFLRLAQQRPDHTGMIPCKLDRDFPGQARRIHDAIAAETDLMGKIIRINRPG